MGAVGRIASSTLGVGTAAAGGFCLTEAFTGAAAFTSAATLTGVTAPVVAGIAGGVLATSGLALMAHD